MIKNKKNDVEMKYIKVPFTLIDVGEIEEKNAKGVNKKFFTFTGYGSTFNNVDRVKDVVVKGAFVDSLKEIMPSLLWQHEWHEPVGIFTACYEDNKGLYVEGKMPLDDDFVRGRVVPQLEIGSVKSMSIGYSTQDYNYDENSGICYLTKLFLYEISLVTIPANKEAVITDMKALIPFQDFSLADKDYKFNKSEALKRVKDFYKTESESRKSFLFFDDNCKLLVSDIVNGKNVIVPEAVFEVAGKVLKANLDISDVDRKGLINNINRYYAKMRKEFCDESIISPFEKSINELKNLREVDNYLKIYGLSTKKCNIIISKIKQFVREGQIVEEENTVLRDAGLDKFLKNVENLKTEVTKNGRRN